MLWAEVWPPRDNVDVPGPAPLSDCRSVPGCIYSRGDHTGEWHLVHDDCCPYKERDIWTHRCLKGGNRGQREAAVDYPDGDFCHRPRNAEVPPGAH